MKRVYTTVRRKPSTAPDGLSSSEASPTSSKPKSNGSVLADVVHSARSGTLGRDGRTVLQGLTTMSEGQPMNDRELLLEHGVSMLQGLPSDSHAGADAAGTLIEMLWKDLPHPPLSLAGPRSTYRSPDGSGNDPWNPEIGKAGGPYSRSVPAVRPKPAVLPEPELVFDTLLKRSEFKPHPSGLSSLFFAFATVVIHECFSTDAKDWWINNTSSYVELSSLYGNNKAQQDSVRKFDGKGSIYPDTIASASIMLMPPAVVAVLILFARNHNQIAHRIHSYNEKGWYTSAESTASGGGGEAALEKLKAEDPEAFNKQEEDIFQLARNVNVAAFATVVLGDYVKAILNTYRSNSEWSLDLGGEIRKKDGSRVDRGGGGVVSVEFNVLYHWHATMSQKDANWIEAVFKKSFPDKNIADITPEEFYQTAGAHAKQLAAQSPKEWTIHGLQRGPDGSYPDEALAKILMDAVDEPAAAFGAHGTPEALKVVEILGMKRARYTWQVCTMNEFRKYLNLKPFESFAEWNRDPKVWKAAEKLYGHIDDLELYPGLMAEEAKPAMAGSGVCPGHTIGRGILDDAVTLVRSDRFLTYDLSVVTLTSWGMSNLTKPCPGALGGVLGSVIFNALPFQFPYNSPYCLIPFYTPQTIKSILKDIGKAKDYDLQRPTAQPRLLTIKSFEACKQAFLDRDTFRVFYNDAIKQVTENRGFLIGFDDAARHDPPKHVIMRAMYGGNFDVVTAEYFASRVDYRVKLMSLAYSGTTKRQIDIVRDVANWVPVDWVANILAIPIKSAEFPGGLITNAELRMLLLGLFVFSSFNIVPKAGWTLRETSIKSSQALSKIIEGRLQTASGWKDSITDWLSKGTAYEDSDESEAFYRELARKGNKPPHEMASDILATFIPVAGNLTQQSSLLVDLYLRPEYAAERARISELAHEDTREADEELAGFVREGMRLQPVVIGLPRVAARDVKVRDGNETVDIRTGDRVIIGTSRAHMDPKAFPDPEKIDPFRPEKAYITLGLGLHYCLGARVAMVGLTAMLKAIFKLKNLRRVDGRGGHFVRAVQDLAGLEAHSYLDQSSSEQPMPISLQLWYDAESPDDPVGDDAVKDIVFVKKAKAQAAAAAAKSHTQDTSPPPSAPASASPSLVRRISTTFGTGGGQKRRTSSKIFGGKRTSSPERLPTTNGQGANGAANGVNGH